MCIYVYIIVIGCGGVGGDKGIEILKDVLEIKLLF